MDNDVAICGELSNKRIIEQVITSSSNPQLQVESDSESDSDI